jgi:CHASE3 domain sensor protein
VTTVTPPRQGAPPARIRTASTTTPGRYRLWSLGTAVLLALATLLTVGSATQMRSSTQRAEATTGPVLVATQQLVSSLAEADAAATSAFLSGRDEDPEQRRLYEQALARAGQQLEEVASLAGKDESVRTVLGRISVQVTRYAGLIEAARATNRVGNEEAKGYLVSAVSLADQLVTGDVKTLTDDAQANLRRDQNERTRGLVLALVALGLALAALGYGQFTLTRTSRRILNPPLVLAAILTVVALAWLARAGQASGAAINEARNEGYDSIVLTAQLGSAGFGAKAAETLAVITGDQAQRRRADDQAARVASAPITPAVAEAIRSGTAGGAPGGLFGQAAAAADSNRERAAVAEAGLRWQRYQGSVAALRTSANPTAVAVGPASSDFNGFNFSVQSILGQNRGQFLDGLASAANRTERLPAAALLLLLALGAMFSGYQLRINDYR